MPALIRWQQRNGEDTNAIRMPGAMVLGIVLGGIAADAMRRNALCLLRPCIVSVTDIRLACRHTSRRPGCRLRPWVKPVR